VSLQLQQLVDLCVRILFMWWQKLKVSCLMCFRAEGTFKPTTNILCRESRTNPLTWEIVWFCPTAQCFLRFCHNTFIFDHLAFFCWKDTLKLNMFWDLLSCGIVHRMKW
jgi:hypothetical protein